MTVKPKIAVNWAGACGGCDVALLDSEDQILSLTDAVEVVYWPVAMDYKRADLAAYGTDEIDIGVFNGVIRTEEHRADAELMRDRCKVLVAFGACAAFGGIPGLANLASNQAILDTVYQDTASTHNPDDVRPQAATTVHGHVLELPELEDRVLALYQVVEVDVVVPGCPPPPDAVAETIDTVIRYAESGALPPAGTVLASDSALCDECPRLESRTDARMSTTHRVHSTEVDPELCFHEQGLVCMGLATRGGCGASCIGVNMPCRGCFGPLPGAFDPAAEALSAIGSIVGLDHEDGVPPTTRMAGVRSIRDLAGTFYRFTLPTATIPGAVVDRPQEED
jgi:F420-non-reducing hydrogenase small subunit